MEGLDTLRKGLDTTTGPWPGIGRLSPLVKGLYGIVRLTNGFFGIDGSVRLTNGFFGIVQLLSGLYGSVMLRNGLRRGLRLTNGLYGSVRFVNGLRGIARFRLSFGMKSLGPTFGNSPVGSLSLVRLSFGINLSSGWPEKIENRLVLFGVNILSFSRLRECIEDASLDRG